MKKNITNELTINQVNQLSLFSDVYPEKTTYEK